ncbi:hypothetical protein GUITHDRAFT_113851 [Guillardia theta CCMP2712]|uniref:RRM domain-containing protein n=1 Tax=Guillardia theta (strain CCMP2712) TaxID=905079 RepID=L1IV43_GUITC|nr:hypothetical protein GUITHDRAFT_113851 [Guillardia theta CCMP2712]EKX40113.1 hypothetical protein GUITHDRAFT_113851 [Guillardia theta CCMP2712]|eukprot:XP_005827093.1 hypothetical protein GUITHDRAFT_113851 [Guillardia theta CCMP2712]
MDLKFSEEETMSLGRDTESDAMRIEQNYGVEVPRALMGHRQLVSDVTGPQYLRRKDGEIVADNGIDSEHRHPYRYKESYDQLPPCNTLYIRNLRERVKPRRMRELLYAVFSQYGKILDVRALKTQKMRGQAFVCFDELKAREQLEHVQGQSMLTPCACQDAVHAKEELNGFSFLNRTLVIQFAKSPSHAHLKKDGTYSEMMQQIRSEYWSNHSLTIRKSVETALESKANTSSVAQLNILEDDWLLSQHGYKLSKEPSRHLLITNCPANIIEQDVLDVLGQFEGLISVEKISGAVAFMAHYEEKDTASEATEALEGFFFPEEPDFIIRLHYITSLHQ